MPYSLQVQSRFKTDHSQKLSWRLSLRYTSIFLRFSRWALLEMREILLEVRIELKQIYLTKQQKLFKRRLLSIARLQISALLILSTNYPKRSCRPYSDRKPSRADLFMYIRPRLKLTSLIALQKHPIAFSTLAESLSQDITILLTVWCEHSAMVKQLKQWLMILDSLFFLALTSSL